MFSLWILTWNMIKWPRKQKVTKLKNTATHNTHRKWKSSAYWYILWCYMRTSSLSVKNIVITTAFVILWSVTMEKVAMISLKKSR